MATVRAAALQDMAGVYRVCDETGPATDNPDLLGHVYAGPYLVNQLDLATVVVDELGVAGYILGCADTTAFEEWCEREWWPLLRDQYPAGSGGRDAGLVRLIHESTPTPADLAAEYPAHLHIDFVDRARGLGYGRRLIEGLFGQLTARGVTGIHLGVGIDNRNAIEFYQHLGFESRDADGDGLWMTRRL